MSQHKTIQLEPPVWCACDFNTGEPCEVCLAAIAANVAVTGFVAGEAIELNLRTGDAKPVVFITLG